MSDLFLKAKNLFKKQSFSKIVKDIYEKLKKPRNNKFNIKDNNRDKSLKKAKTDKVIVTTNAVFYLIKYFTTLFSIHTAK